MSVRVVLNPNALNLLLASPQGAIAKDLLRRAQRVENRAKVLCPVDKGRLRASIFHELVLEGSSTYAIVGTNVEYAKWVHTPGTRRFAGVPFLADALSAAAG